MDTGRALRHRRVFGTDGRSLVVALDHLAAMPTSIPALADPAGVVRAAREGGADAVLIPPAALRQARDELGQLGVVLSVPCGPDSWRYVPEQALRAGADMVKVLFFPFGDAHEEHLAWLAALGAACAHWGLPLLVEALPGGFGGDDSMRRAQVLAAAARVAVECGATVIKTFTPIDDDVAHLSSYAGVPVLLLGGERTDTEALARDTARAVDAGAAGVAIGRNIWGAPDPVAVVRALAQAVHGPRGGS